MDSETDRALQEVADAVRSVPDAELDAVVDELLAARRIACYGGGREGLVMRGLVMRLFHAGLDVHYVGEMTCPAVGPGDLLVLCFGLLAALVIAVTFHRRFTAAAFDERIAVTLGLKPRMAQVVLVGLVTLAVVASFQAVGTLLVVGLLLAPVVAANRWTTRIPSTMALAAVFGSAAVAVGLCASWYLGTAAGASIAGTAILAAAFSGVARAGLDRLRSTDRHHETAALTAIHEVERIP